MKRVLLICLVIVPLFVGCGGSSEPKVSAQCGEQAIATAETLREQFRAAGRQNMGGPADIERAALRACARGRWVD